MSNQPTEPLENTKKESGLEYGSFYKNVLKKQYLEVERWKLKVELVSSMKNKEVQKMHAKMIELKNMQDKVYKKKVENCDFIHNLMKNSWMANLGNNSGCTTRNTVSSVSGKKTGKSRTNNSFILIKLEEDLTEIKSILEALNVIREQDKKLNQYILKTNSIEHSITIWNEKISKIELNISESKNIN